jgi:hypothetical protein
LTPARPDAKAKRAPTEAADPDAGVGGVSDGDTRASGIVKLFNKGIDRLCKAVS